MKQEILSSASESEVQHSAFGLPAAICDARISAMIGRPEKNEAAQYYFTYIDRVSSDDIVGALQTQLDDTLAFLSGISEDKSLHRYAPDKWSIRQVQNHINDGERVFLFRALWFARGFEAPLPSFDQDIAVRGAEADHFSWASQIEEFRQVRLATLSFFQNLPPQAWMRTGVASDNPFTVRALGYITAGHVAHHRAILEERYL